MMLVLLMFDGVTEGFAAAVAVGVGMVVGIYVDGVVVAVVVVGGGGVGRRWCNCC